MENPSTAKIREEIIIDGVAGHLIPPSETEKLQTVNDENGTPIAEFSEDFKTFTIHFPDQETRTYEVISEKVNKKSGFKAVAYRETSPDGSPKESLDGKCELRMSFQGLVAGWGDIKTGARAVRGKNPAQHVEEVEEFTREAIENVGGAGKVSALISGSHSYGVGNALESYRVAQDMGVSNIRVMLLEAIGAASALADMAQRVANGDVERAEAFANDVVKHVITVNAEPSSHFVKMARGDAVGTVYHLCVPPAEGAMGKLTDGINRHRLGTLMQSVLSGVELEQKGAVTLPKLNFGPNCNR